MIDLITDIANHIYQELGPGHKDKTYRDAMAMELQDRGYTVKTESPISIAYTTLKQKTMIVGSGNVDICVNDNGKYTFIEIRAMLKFFNERKEIDEINYLKIRKYLASIGLENGILINFPFPPIDNVEIIEY